MKSQFEDSLRQRIADCGVIAVLVIDDAAHAVPLAKALMDGGVEAMELTLRTPAALDSLKQIRQHVPEMMAGIGTILTVEQVHQVSDAKATFGVSPGTNPRIVNEAKKLGLPFAPGIVTPSDIEVALELGCRDTKFFPAGPSGGLEYLKSIAAPYQHLGCQYVPLGGIKTSNMREYLASPLILAVGGSWLAPRDQINQQDWAKITQTASEARKIVDDLRTEQTA